MISFFFLFSYITFCFNRICISAKFKLQLHIVNGLAIIRSKKILIEKFLFISESTQQFDRFREMKSKQKFITFHKFKCTNVYGFNFKLNSTLKFTIQSCLKLLLFESKINSVTNICHRRFYKSCFTFRFCRLSNCCSAGYQCRQFFLQFFTLSR